MHEGPGRGAVLPAVRHGACQIRDLVDAMGLPAFRHGACRVRDLAGAMGLTCVIGGPELWMREGATPHALPLRMGCHSRPQP